MQAKRPIRKLRLGLHLSPQIPKSPGGCELKKVYFSFKTLSNAYSLFLTRKYWKKGICCSISESSIMFLPLFYLTFFILHWPSPWYSVNLADLLLLWCFISENTFCLNDLRGKRYRDLFLVYLSNCKRNSSIKATDFKLFLWQLHFIDYFSSFGKLVGEDTLFPLSIITPSDSSSREWSLWSKEKWFERRKAQNWTQALFMCLEAEGGINLFKQSLLGL